MEEHAVWKKSISISTECCLDLQYLQMVRACGFAGIDLNFSNSFFETKSDNQLETICANLYAVNLACAQVHLPTYDLFADSSEDDPEIERRIAFVLRAMPVLKAQWGAFHVRSAVKDGFDRKRALRDNVESLKRLCGVAERYGVGIAVENLPTFPDRPDAPFYSSRIEDHCEVIDAVNHPLIGGCWDFGHANLNVQHKDRSQKELLSILGDRVKLVHVHNNYATRDSHLPPSIGSVDWMDAIAGLRETGFSGFFSLECGCGGSNLKLAKAYCEFCGKTTDIILEE